MSDTDDDCFDYLDDGDVAKVSSIFDLDSNNHHHHGSSEIPKLKRETSWASVTKTNNRRRSRTWSDEHLNRSQTRLLGGGGNNGGGGGNNTPRRGSQISINNNNHAVGSRNRAQSLDDFHHHETTAANNRGQRRGGGGQRNSMIKRPMLNREMSSWSKSRLRLGVGNEDEQSSNLRVGSLPPSVMAKSTLNLFNNSNNRASEKATTTTDRTNNNTGNNSVKFPSRRASYHGSTNNNKSDQQGAADAAPPKRASIAGSGQSTRFLGREKQVSRTTATTTAAQRASALGDDDDDSSSSSSSSSSDDDKKSVDVVQAAQQKREVRPMSGSSASSRERAVLELIRAKDSSSGNDRAAALREESSSYDSSSSSSSDDSDEVEIVFGGTDVVRPTSYKKPIGGGGDDAMSASLGELGESKSSWQMHRPRRQSKISEYSGSLSESGFLTLDDEQDIHALGGGGDGDESSTDRDDDDDDNTSEDEYRQIIFFGIYAPKWFSRILPTGTQTAAWIVTRAPCFWFSDKYPTDRVILYRLNVLCTIMALSQIGFALWMLVVLVNPGVAYRGPLDNGGLIDGTQKQITSPIAYSLFVSMWNANVYLVGIGLLAVTIVAAAIWMIPVLRYVDLVGCLRYLWYLLWVLPGEIFLCIGLFDVFGIVDVWIRHWWRNSTMAWFRAQFCTAGTADRECTVPISSNETSWCLFYYNATNCTQIRNDAQEVMTLAMDTIYFWNGIWAVALIFLLLLSMNALGRIISGPLVQKSSENSLPMWLLLPGAMAFVAGYAYLSPYTPALSIQSEVEIGYLGPLYMITSSLFFLCSFLGFFASYKPILNVADKRQKYVAIVAFIGTMVMNVAVLATIFVGSLVVGGQLAVKDVSTETRGDVACLLDGGGSCTNCDHSFEVRCPEWTASDIRKVFQTHSKTSATLSAILLLYSCGALTFGFSLRKHVNMYLIDFV